jgi:hypothetical protein
MRLADNPDIWLFPQLLLTGETRRGRVWDRRGEKMKER